MDGNLLRNFKASHRGEYMFGKFLSCGEFHSLDSCVLLNAKCFTCGKIGDIQSVCQTTVHFAANNTRLYKSNLINLAIPVTICYPYLLLLVFHLTLENDHTCSVMHLTILVLKLAVLSSAFQSGG